MIPWKDFAGSVDENVNISEGLIMTDCDRCGGPVEDYVDDWDLARPLCLDCWFEEHRNNDVDD